MADRTEQEDKQRSCFGCIGAALLLGILNTSMSTWEQSTVGRALAVGLMLVGFWIGYRFGYLILGALLLWGLAMYVVEGPTSTTV